MREHKLKTEQESDAQPTEAMKVVVRTLFSGFLVPIICGLPELMVINKQLLLRTKDGLVLARQTTTPIAFLSGVSMGWISGGLKTVSYANKELICEAICIIRGNDQQDNSRYNPADRVYASIFIGGIDAVSTHGPSSMRTLVWTNPAATVALSHMPFWLGLSNIYKIGFTTRLLKACVNASCYVAITPWLEKKSQATFPESLSIPLAVLSSGILSGFMCTALDVIGVHIYKEAVLTNKKVRVPSLIKMGRGMYKQNGLRIFTSGAGWNAVVSALAFGTMTSVEQFVNSEAFTKIYQESYRFFKRASAKKLSKSSTPLEPTVQDQKECSSIKNCKH